MPDCKWGGSQKLTVGRATSVIRVQESLKSLGHKAGQETSSLGTQGRLREDSKWGEVVGSKQRLQIIPWG